MVRLAPIVYRCRFQQTLYELLPGAREQHVLAVRIVGICRNHPFKGMSFLTLDTVPDNCW